VSYAPIAGQKLLYINIDDLSIKKLIKVIIDTCNNN